VKRVALTKRTVFAEGNVTVGAGRRATPLVAVADGAALGLVETTGEALGTPIK
jgi:hypothetical protein